MTNINLVTKCFIFNDKNQILILRRSDDDDIRPGQWDLAGGRVDENEDPNNCIVRETLEETNFMTTAPKIIYIATENSQAYILTLFYQSSLLTGQIKLSDEHTEHKWVSLEEFKKLDLPQKFHSAADSLTITLV